MSGLEIFWKISAMMAIPFWLGLFWRRATPAAAWAATLASFVTWLFTGTVEIGGHVLWDFDASLAGALPHPDVLAPSIEELAFMLRRRQYDRLIAAGDVLHQLTPRLLQAEDLSTAADYACVVGAQSLRALDTTSGVGTWQDPTAGLSAPRVRPIIELG